MTEKNTRNGFIRTCLTERTSRSELFFMRRSPAERVKWEELAARRGFANVADLFRELIREAELKDSKSGEAKK